MNGLAEVEGSEVVFAHVEVDAAQVVEVHQGKALSHLGEELGLGGGAQHLDGFPVVATDIFEVAL